METLTPESREQTPSSERIEDPDLAFDVAHDSVVQGRQEALRQARESAAYFTEHGGNAKTAEQAVAEARDAVNDAIESAVPLYQEDKKDQ